MADKMLKRRKQVLKTLLKFQILFLPCLKSIRNAMKNMFFKARLKKFNNELMEKIDQILLILRQ